MQCLHFLTLNDQMVFLIYTRWGPKVPEIVKKNYLKYSFKCLKSSAEMLSRASSDSC
jgi:hypothetical protein